MSLRFPYSPVAVSLPVISIAGKHHGQTIRPRPLVNVAVIGPTGLTQLVEAIIDTAADDTVFPDHLADVVDVDLTQQPTRTAAGVGGKKFQLHYADVILRLADPYGHRLEWPAMVGFSSAKGQYPMLGYAGFLQFFDATFFGELEEVVLQTNGTYPGT